MTTNQADKLFDFFSILITTWMFVATILTQTEHFFTWITGYVPSFWERTSVGLILCHYLWKPVTGFSTWYYYGLLKAFRRLLHS